MKSTLLLFLAGTCISLALPATKAEARTITVVRYYVLYEAYYFRQGDRIQSQLGPFTSRADADRAAASLRNSNPNNGNVVYNHIRVIEKRMQVPIHHQQFPWRPSPIYRP